MLHRTMEGDLLTDWSQSEDEQQKNRHCCYNSNTFNTSMTFTDNTHLHFPAPGLFFVTWQDIKEFI